ncbi:protein-disulfide reductase DsbD domain-containing protein [Kordia sp.]|jgi:thiol:disulfide interchange protein DsbD|uniref:protein-disulfide reductase DsbD domain-containing protein n=1 Tax=Kordia sp. TaxID=1965332 RepID=UPI0025C4A59A|nr:protein-disulfide reductase DsbD domain-containing protein [Kordia sp.]MCH2080931.1 protein-disulfide reductase DsbD N-terminal domain-containing protein [Saprospiraceae bacterium]MCH2193275.1 protein-disulfide reductase DsbD N-terminal domain-containing protein [Kordia sp.]
MKIWIFLIAFFACANTPLTAQLNPVKWDFSAEKVDLNTYELVFKAEINDGWYVYSQYIGEDGPIPTSLYFADKLGVTILEQATEEGGKKIEGYDNMFDMELVKFAHKMIIRQKVKLINGATNLKGYLEFMTCDNAQCLPPKAIDFAFELN